LTTRRGNPFGNVLLAVLLAKKHSQAQTVSEKMTKLVLIHYITFRTEFQKNNKKLASMEWDRYNSLAKKNGIKILAYDDDPWGTDYNRIRVLESKKGMEAWNDFISEYVAHGTSEAWKYVKVSRTSIVPPIN